MRHALAFVLIVSLAAIADEPAKTILYPLSMKVGDSGELKTAAPKGGSPPVYTVMSVKDDTLLIEYDMRNGKTITFAVRGIEIKGIVDGQRWRPEGKWVVTKTEKFGSRTLNVIERMK